MMKISNGPRKNFIHFLILSISVVGMPWTASAEEISDFPQAIEAEGWSLVLQGKGLKRLLFVKAFEAAFYRSSQSHSFGLVSPMKIKVKYYINIPGKKLSRFTIKHMKKNISQEEFQQIRQEIEEMKNMFVDLHPGDTFSITYLPGIGTKFVHNQQLRGYIPGELFAYSLFSVWIGEKPFDRKLKKQLLRNDKMQTQKRNRKTAFHQ